MRVEGKQLKYKHWFLFSSKVVSLRHEGSEKDLVLAYNISQKVFHFKGWKRAKFSFYQIKLKKIIWVFFQKDASKKFSFTRYLLFLLSSIGNEKISLSQTKTINLAQKGEHVIC